MPPDTRRTTGIQPNPIFERDRLISAILDEARQKGQDLVLDVLTVNYRAQALYERLGMTEVARHGDNNIKITMRSAQPRRDSVQEQVIHRS